MFRLSAIGLSVFCGVIVAALSPAIAGNAKYYMTVVDATSTGTDTGVAFTAGQTVSVKAAGYVSGGDDPPQTLCTATNPSLDCWATPSGFGSVPDDFDPDCLAGNLLGTIAGSGVYHCLGPSAKFTADATGDLVLLINDDVYADNSGAFVVLIQAPRR
jgi:hypothetical protein